VFADDVALIFAELPPFLPLFDRQYSPDRLEDPGPDGPQFRELLATGQRIVVPELDERFEFQRESVSDSGCGWRDQTRARNARTLTRVALQPVRSLISRTDRSSSSSHRMSSRSLGSRVSARRPGLGIAPFA